MHDMRIIYHTIIQHTGYLVGEVLNLNMREGVALTTRLAHGHEYH